MTPPGRSRAGRGAADHPPPDAAPRQAGAPGGLRARLVGEWAVFLLAVQFLTRLPIRDPGYSPARMAATPRHYPLVGLLVGLLGAGAGLAAGLALGPALGALVAVALPIWATGAFHEDGLADTLDGLGGAVSRDRALEIMRDSRLGTYGAVGLALALAAQVMALAAMAPAVMAAAVVGAHAAGRASAVLVIATSAYVRDHGTGKPVATGLTRTGLGLALSTGAASLLPLAWIAGVGAAAAALAGLAAGHLAARAGFERRLGGYTGDTLGAVVVASATGLMLGVAAWV